MAVLWERRENQPHSFGIVAPEQRIPSLSTTQLRGRIYPRWVL